MCDRLSALLLSPVWGGDIGRVRYALQTAVLRRRNGIKLEGSGRPTSMPSLGSQSSLGMDEFARTMQAIAQLEGIVGSEATVEVKAGVVAMARATYSPTDKDKLLRQIITAIETAPEIDQCPRDGNETKSGLYLLRIDDVQLVTEVVDCLGHLDPVRMTCLDRLRQHFPDPDRPVATTFRARPAPPPPLEKEVHLEREAGLCHGAHHAAPGAVAREPRLLSVGCTQGRAGVHGQLADARRARD